MVELSCDGILAMLAAFIRQTTRHVQYKRFYCYDYPVGHYLQYLPPLLALLRIHEACCFAHVCVLGEG